jgi:hypothetical protein
MCVTFDASHQNGGRFAGQSEGQAWDCLAEMRYSRVLEKPGMARISSSYAPYHRVLRGYGSGVTR